MMMQKFLLSSFGAQLSANDALPTLPVAEVGLMPVDPGRGFSPDDPRTNRPPFLDLKANADPRTTRYAPNSLAAKVFTESDSDLSERATALGVDFSMQISLGLFGSGSLQVQTQSSDQYSSKFQSSSLYIAYSNLVRWNLYTARDFDRDPNIVAILDQISKLPESEIEQQLNHWFAVHGTHYVSGVWRGDQIIMKIEITERSTARRSSSVETVKAAMSGAIGSGKLDISQRNEVANAMQHCTIKVDFFGVGRGRQAAGPNLTIRSTEDIDACLTRVRAVMDICAAEPSSDNELGIMGYSLTQWGASIHPVFFRVGHEPTSAERGAVARLALLARPYQLVVSRLRAIRGRPSLSSLGIDYVDGLIRIYDTFLDGVREIAKRILAGKYAGDVSSAELPTDPVELPWNSDRAEMFYDAASAFNRNPALFDRPMPGGSVYSTRVPPPTTIKFPPRGPQDMPLLAVRLREVTFTQMSWDKSYILPGTGLPQKKVVNFNSSILFNPDPLHDYWSAGHWFEIDQVQLGHRVQLLATTPAPAPDNDVLLQLVYTDRRFNDKMYVDKEFKSILYIPREFLLHAFNYKKFGSSLDPKVKEFFDNLSSAPGEHISIEDEPHSITLKKEFDYTTHDGGDAGSIMIDVVEDDEAEAFAPE